MKEKLLEALFDDYYGSRHVTEESEEARELAKDYAEELKINAAIVAEGKQAFTAGFNAALALMGGVQ